MKHRSSFLLLFAFLWIVVGAPGAYAQAPTANPDTAFTFVGVPVDIDVLANDVNNNPTLSQIVILRDLLREPDHGTAFVDRNGTFSDPEDDFIHYEPDAGYVGTDTLIYVLEESFGSQDDAMVVIFMNVLPVAEDDAERVFPDSTSFLDVLANDTDADGDSLIIEALATLPLHGMAAAIDTMGRPQLIEYTPDAGFTGRDSLRYALFDGKNGRDSAWVNITVNTPPTAVNDTTTTLPGTPLDIDVLDNDADPDGQALTLNAIATAPSHGTAVISGSAVTYTPQAGFSGEDSFVYVAADPLGGTDEALVFIVVNTPPVAEDDSVSTVFEMPLDIDVLDNDVDADGDALTVTDILVPASDGDVEIIDSGQAIRYTPDADFFGADTFEYAISDGNGGVGQAAVTIAVLADAAVQIIHNAAGVDPVDIYADGVRVVDDLAFQTATAFLPVPAGGTTVDVTDGAAADNSNPVFSTTLTLVPLETYVVIARGVPGANLGFSVKVGARLTADVPNLVEFFVAHGVPDAPASGIDVRQLDPFNENRPSLTLADNLNFGALTDYVNLGPTFQNLDVTSFDNATQYDAFRFDLNALEGQTFTLVASGRLADGSLTLIGFDVNGDPVVPAVVTATEEEPAELPAEFALKGNYPNPFNPTTTLQFDLPETAEVTVEIIDVLGRTVMTLPAQTVEAGANRALEIHAARLASGTYLYRVIARTATETLTRTGRMTLVK